MRTQPPDFLILGAQKAGTTALFAYLEHHPRIVSARLKEVCFFSKDVLHNRGPGQYHRYFKESAPHQLCFEATPEYLYYPFVAKRVQAYNPRIKLIVLLRDPVERAFSAWNMFRKWHQMPGNKTEIIRHHLKNVNPDYQNGYSELMLGSQYADFYSCVTREAERLRKGEKEDEPGFVARGLYHKQILPYLDHFQPNQMLFIHNRDLQVRTREVLDRVCAFLGVECLDWPPALLSPVHAIAYEQTMDGPSRHFLREFFFPENKKLENLLQETFNWD